MTPGATPRREARVEMTRETEELVARVELAVSHSAILVRALDRTIEASRRLRAENERLRRVGPKPGAGDPFRTPEASRR
jgi:hypothetical protein